MNQRESTEYKFMEQNLERLSHLPASLEMLTKTMALLMTPTSTW